VTPMSHLNLRCLATFSMTRDGHWQFRKCHYEPGFKGGNSGMKTGTQQT